MVLALGITSAVNWCCPHSRVYRGSLASGRNPILLLWATIRLAFAAGSDLSIEAYRRTLYQPYWVHASRNTSQVISGIGKVNSAISVLSQLMTLISSAVLLVAIMLALLAIDPMVASVAAGGFGASYAFISWNTRRRLLRNSQLVAHEQTQVVKAVQEGLGGIRDVLLEAHNQFIATYPAV